MPPPSGGRAGRSAAPPDTPSFWTVSLGRVLQLTLLAPDIVEAILDGRQPEGLGLPGLMEPFPTAWDAQRIALAEPV